MTTTAPPLDIAGTPSIDEHDIEDFVATLKSPQTRRTYHGALRRWLAWLDDRESDRDGAQEWVDHLLSAHLRDNTVATYATAIKHCWKWRHGTTMYLQAPGIAIGEPRYHPVSQINQMIELAGPLERTFIGVLFSSGCRLAEGLTLETQKIAWGQNLINVAAKGGDDEDVNISDGGLEYLRVWLDIRVGDPPLVFWDYIGGKDLDNKSRNFRRKLDALGKRVGIEDFKPHDLRHSRAMDLLDSGVPLERVSELMRHNNIQTTIKFYGKRRPVDRQADLEKGAELPPQPVPSRYATRKVRP